MTEPQMLRDAKELFEYLYVRDVDCQHADLIIGFGHFDLKIPRQCAYLYGRSAAPKILFSGGRGSGSADLEDAEAVAFSSVLLAEFPKIPSSDVIVESNSKNTGENITMSAKVLKERDIGKNFESGINSIIAVASPYRQRRVWRTFQLHLPKIKIFNMPPQTTFEQEVLLFNQNGEDFFQLLVGEVQRIISYPDKGFMASEELPVHVMNSYMSLRRKREE
jgi:uncharacterized SAM-binding protein YcdF (DUF218 family)